VNTKKSPHDDWSARKPRNPSERPADWDLLVQQPRSTSFDLPVATPKKHSVRFDATKERAEQVPIQTVYVTKAWVEEHGAENGVRVTIEPLSR